MNRQPRVTIGAVVFNNEEKILLLKSPKWNGKYILSCGHVEFGETLEDAVKREVREETNLNVDDVKFLRVVEFINSSDYYNRNLHFIGLQHTCKTHEKEVRINREADSYIWTSPLEALKMDLEKGTRATIEYYLSSIKSK